MNILKLEDLYQPIGNLMSHPHYLPPSPGEPKYSTYGANLGDLNQIKALSNHNNGNKMEISGAGGDLNPNIGKLKAGAETLERYCNAFYNENQFIWATANELGNDAMDLDKVPLFSEKEVNNQMGPFVKPDKNQKIRWVRGVSLTNDQIVWIPAVMVYLFIPYQSPAEAFHLPISTGTATHTSYEQATVNGINEVIERDAISLTWLQKISWPKLTIDLDRLPSWAMDFYEESEKNEHFKTIYLDATTDIGIPTIYSVQFTPHNPKIATVVMCTTALDPLEAFTKITREGASVRLALQNLDSKKTDINDFVDVFDGAQYMGGPDKIKEFDFLSSSSQSSELLNMPNLKHDTTKQDLDFLIKKLKDKNMEVFVVDLTTDESLRCGFRTVKVIIPELQPLSFVYRAKYLAHPRLYEAPKNMGFKVKTEDEINSNPMPFA